jgi:hypothetical protein
LIEAVSNSNFLYTEQVVRSGVLRGQMFQLLDTKESLKLDIYPRELIPGELRRSETVELFKGVYLPIVCRTDAALSKLIWVDKGSHRSRRDLRSIFRNCSPVQQESIRESARSMALDQLLETILTESDEIR